MILACALFLFGCNEQAYLQRYCDQEARALQLTDWTITVVLQSSAEIGYPTFLGHVKMTWEGKTAVIRVMQRRAYRQTDSRWRSDQKDTIRHELLHILYRAVNEETLVERVTERLK